MISPRSPSHCIDGFEPERMAGRHDCGPTAMLQVLRHGGLEIDRRGLYDLWGFRDDCDRLDTPGHHLRVLRRLGVRHAMRRRLGIGELCAALDRKLPVVYLVPRGPLSWHWIVVCGMRGSLLRASCGDGVTLDVDAGSLVSFSRAHRVGRALHVDGLGYAVGESLPFGRDVGLERLQVRLACAAEEYLRPFEAAAGLVRSAASKLGWNMARGGDILSPVECPEIEERAT